MRTLSHAITFLLILFHLIGKAQINIQQDRRIDPILKQVAAKHPGLKIFSRKDGKGGYVNMAVLNENVRQLKWFTCYGVVFDSVFLEKDEYNQLLTGMLDPFAYYQGNCYEQLFYIEQAELLYRVRGKAALADTSWNNRLIFSTPVVRYAESSLQKLMAMEGLMKRVWLQLRLFYSRPPLLLARNSNDSSRAWQSLAGTMIKTTDSTEFYNVDQMASAARIVLRQQSPNRLFVFNREGALIDSIPLKAGKYASLLKEKEDVFLLYRGWLEMQWKQVTDDKLQYVSRLRNLDSSFYSQVAWEANIHEIRRILLNFRDQQLDISSKIFSLIVPIERYVEQRLADAYQDEMPPQISYLPGLGFSYTISNLRGQKVYELAEHRGNVMAVVNDRKKGIDEDTNGVIDYYNAAVVSANDYYPFGMLQPGREYKADKGYRYGYNGKENDNEVKGEGNQQDYGMRIYDPRVGRFLSTDPVTRSFPQLTPYQFANNRPVQGIDLDGLELFPTIKQVYSYENGARIKVVADAVIKVKVLNLSAVANDQLDLNSIRMDLESSLETAFAGTDPAGDRGAFTVTANSFYRTEKMNKGLARVKMTSENRSQQLTYKVSVNAEVTVVNSIDQVGKDDWVFAIVDQVNDTKKQENAGVARIHGKVSIGEAQFFTTQEQRSGDGKKLALHEVLHLLGADDIYNDENKKNQKNAMNSIGPLNNGLLNAGQVVNEIWGPSMGTWDQIWNGHQNNDYKKNSGDDDKGDTRTQLKDFIRKNGEAAGLP